MLSAVASANYKNASSHTAEMAVRTAVLLLAFPLHTLAFIPLGQKPVLLPDPRIGRLDPVIEGVVMVRFRPEHISGAQQAIPPLPLKAVRAEPLLPWAHSLHAGALLRARPRQLGAALRAEEPLLRTFLVEYSEPLPPEEVCKILLSRCPAVELAEPYTLNQPLFVPNDPLVARQRLLWVINAFAAWDIGQGDSSVVIGIVDTGVLYTHEDLFGSLWYNRGEIPDNGIDDDGNGYVDDYLGYNFAWRDDGTQPGDPRNSGEGHGTGVAGIATATVNNGKGIAGIGFRCRFFPLKAAPEGVPSLYYAYQGVLYCALMGFAVVNCSWGNRTYSCINQSVVDYARARGTLVVAAAGNTPEASTAWYPAGYPGVLGVGNTDTDDRLHPLSARGIGTTLLAPGEGAWTTSNEGTYTTFGGTSAAAPIVSAAAALLRSLHPQLDPLQTLALLRRTADDVAGANSELAPWLPGRLNLWAALASPPEEAPGFVLPELRVLSADGRRRRRWSLGDTLWLQLWLYNALGSGSGLTCRLRALPDTALILLDTLTALPSVAAASPVVVGPFRAFVQAPSTTPTLLRVEFSDSSATYRDVLFVTLVPTPAAMTFSNATTAFSIADDGALGFADYPQNTQGVGFRYRDACNLLYGGGLFAVELSTGRHVSAAPSGLTRDRDFVALKPFAEPREEQNMLSDANAPLGNRIGLLLQQHFLGFSAESSGVARFLVTAWNISGLPRSDLAIGYLMDWDASQGGRSDRVRFLPEAQLPEVILPHGAEVVEQSGSPVVGACIVALDTAAQIQCAGIPTAMLFDTDGFSAAEKLRLLSSGTTIQYADSGDVALVVGVRFRSLWQPDQLRQFVLCFGAAESTEHLVAEFHECIRYAQTLMSADPAATRLRLSYVDGYLVGELPTGDVWTLELWDLLGRRLWLERRYLPAGPVRIAVPASAAGIVLVRLASVHTAWQHLVIRYP